MSENALTNAVKATRVSNAVVAGTGTINGTGVDMTGFESVRFLALIGTIVSGAATSMKLQQSDDDGSSDDYSDIADTSITIADDDDDKVIIADLVRVQKKWVRPVISRATQNATVDGIVAEQYGPRTAPVTQASSISSEVNVDKAEGTA